jgi:tetratricopeptide (TPR) repeat protein
MAGEKSNDTFISYRRDVGWLLAQALWEYLREHGIDAFYDIESIRAGEFEKVILGQIAARPYFILVLTPGTLERCSEPDDWVRQEIEHAVATERVIVPAYTPLFDLNDCDRFLPGGLGRRVKGYQAQELPQKWFKFAVRQLVEEYLLPIDLHTAQTPATEQRVVEQIQHKAEAAPTVTPDQLSAQEYFERAYSRPDADLDGAIADYTEAIRLDPGNALAFNNRGSARNQKGDLDGAIADCNEALRLDPQLALALINRGTARMYKGDLDGAIADCNEAIRLDPKNALAYGNRGLPRRRKGDLDGAIADYTEAIRLDPGNARVFNNRGVARGIMGDFDGALSDCNEAIRLDPGNANAFDSRGTIHQNSGDLDGAIADFDEAIRLDATHADFFTNRAQARRLEGDLDGAIADCNEAIRLDPSIGG